MLATGGWLVRVRVTQMRVRSVSAVQRIYGRDYQQLNLVHCWN